MNTTQYRGASLADTSRGPSPSIWADCPALEIMAGIKDGYHSFDDFLSGPRVAASSEADRGNYRGFASTGGYVGDGDGIGGTLTCLSDGDDEGASFRTATAPFQISNSHGKLWFEARVKSSTITDTKHGIFVGLMDNSTLTATVPIAAAGTLADVNLVGFHRLEGDGDYFDSVYKADGVTQVTLQSDAVLIAADTWVKLGFVYSPRTKKLLFYANGVKLATEYTMPAAAGTDFPNDVRLGFCIAMLNNTGTTPGAADIDWWRCAQLTA